MVNTANSEGNEAPIVLKHRIAGAAFLLLCGAVLLPWVLGPHSSADANNQKADRSQVGAGSLQTDSNGQASSDKNRDTVFGQVMANTENSGGELQNAQSVEVSVEQDNDYVYISKITPLDADSQNLDSSASQQKPDAIVASSNSNGVNQEAANKVETNVEQAAEKKVEKKAENKPIEQAKTKAAPVLAEPQAVSPSSAQKETSVASKPSSSNSEVKSGWIVSVGVYSKTANAESIYRELVKNKYSPSSSVINTSKGKATRVWLGPFADKANALKIKDKLKSVTGEPGLLKAYP
jgi:cell division septation protein DedD